MAGVFKYKNCCFEGPFIFENSDDRIKDLLDIGLTLCEDASGSIPGEIDGEASRFHKLNIKVRDHVFWNDPSNKDLLCDLLYLNTNAEYRIGFSKQGQKKNINRGSRKSVKKDEKLVTFLSNGIDAAAGAIYLLESNPRSRICFVTGGLDLTNSTSEQNELSEKISRLYPGRCSTVRFGYDSYGDYSSDLQIFAGSFLEKVVTFAVSRFFNQDHFTLNKNGISSINFRGMNSLVDPADRFNNNMTLHLLGELFSRAADKSFHIVQPFLFKSHRDIIDLLKQFNRMDLLDSTVSCGQKHYIPPGYTHCGTCGPCIARQIVLFASGYWEKQRHKFYNDIFSETSLTPLTIEKLGTFFREIKYCLNQDRKGFYRIWGDEIRCLEKHISPDQKTALPVKERIYDLCTGYFEGMRDAINLVRSVYDSPWTVFKRKAFFSVLNENYNYMLAPQSAGVSESGYEYSDSFDPAADESEKKGPKKIIEKVMDACKELIKRNEISEETGEGEVVAKVLKLLRKRSQLTSTNVRTINDYFRKGILQIRTKGGELTIVKVYVKNRLKPDKTLNFGLS